MASSPTNENTTATPNLADLSFTTTTSSSTDRQDQIPVLPLEVLRQTLDQLGNVVDLANVAMVCRDWRELINSCDACWEKAFFRDYNKYNAEDYVKLPTWRQKYMQVVVVDDIFEKKIAKLVFILDLFFTILFSILHVERVPWTLHTWN